MYLHFLKINIQHYQFVETLKMMNLKNLFSFLGVFNPLKISND